MFNITSARCLGFFTATGLLIASGVAAQAVDLTPVVLSNSVKSVGQQATANGIVRPYISQSSLTAAQSTAPIKFEVALQMRNFAELQERVAKGERVSTTEMAQKYEPLASDYQAAVNWANSEGLTIVRQDDHHMVLFLSGTVAHVSQALKVGFARVTSDGKEYTSAISAPSVPAAISASLLGINGLQPHLRRHKHILRRSQARPDAESGDATYMPSQIAAAYNVTPLYNSNVRGSGQTIAIVIDTFPTTSDLVSFWHNTGVAQSISNVQFIQAVSGSLPAPSGEETLDVEWSSAMAPSAKIRVYAATDLANEDLDEAYQRVLDDVTNSPSLNIHQMSMSYGEGETDITDSQLNTDAQFFAELAAQGVTCFASSGDEGSTPNDNTGGENGPLQVENPASDPSVTGVGGTTLILNSGNAVSSETVWNDGSFGGTSGGGVSIFFARPSWQTGTGVTTSAMRQVPDIACAADPNFGAYFFFQGSASVIGGTSWASPTCAGFCALINQSRTTAGLSLLGIFGPSLYPQIGTSNLRDITSGNNTTSRSDGKYVATTGYDECTGVGVPLMQPLTETLSNTTSNANATVTLTNLVTTYTGSPQSVTATTIPSGLPVTITYNGSSTPPTNAGTYPVVATINSPGANGSATGTMVINKASATVTLNNLAASFDGSPQAVTATTTPSGLGVNLTYNGNATAPTAVGKYTVVATVNNENYTGTTSGTLVISPATATVTLGNLTDTYSDKAQSATATTTPAGLPVTFTYNGKTTVPVNAGTYTVVATIDSLDAQGTATGTLTINPEPATVTLTPSTLAVIYTGAAHAVTATTVPAKLAVTFTYNGSSAAPVNVGNYAVVGTINNINFTGSASGTLDISPVPPLATTGVATAIGANTATLNASINPKGSQTTVQFQYGTSTAYGTTISAQTVPAGTAAVSVPQPISGLSPKTIYHYRVVVSNGVETVNGADKTFTTLAQPVFASTASYLAASGAEVTQSVNPNGVATSVYFEYSTSNNFSTFLQTATQAIGAGKTAVTVYALFPNLEKSTAYFYQMVTVSAAGTFFGPVETFTTLGFDTTVIAYKGEATGTSNATFSTFGSPAVNAQDGAAFEATLTGTGLTAVNDLGIFADDNTGTLQLVAQTGQASLLTNTGTGTATFVSLGNPLYNNNAWVAFGGQLKVVAGEATAATELGVWCNSTGSLTLVAREGSPAPNTTSGTTLSTFSAFDSVGLSDVGTVIVATLTANTAAGVTTATNLGIWEGTMPANLALELRTGQVVGSKTISKLTYLSSQTLVGGQTRNFASNSGDLALGATFTDKTTGIVKVAGITNFTGGTASVVASTDDDAVPVPGVTGATYSVFSSPIINTNDNVAFEATLATLSGVVTTTTNAGIWADDNTGTLQLVARSGTVAPGTTAAFVTLSDPVYNDNEAVAFHGTLKVAAGQATAATASGIWSNSTGTLSLVAQQGTQAAGCPAGATFATFTALALADQAGTSGTGGLSFLGTLNASSAAGVTAANNTGIWAIDTTGTLQLIVRTGDILPVNGVNKTVTALAFLPTSSVTDGQSRGFAQEDGDLVYLATFSDKTTAIFNVVF